MSKRRNLNGLEFCYRTLTDRCGFERSNIQVLNYEGARRTTDDAPGDNRLDALWPGDSTRYRLRVTGEGSREAFRAALNTLKSRLADDDLLFVHTSGHGGGY